MDHLTHVEAVLLAVAAIVGALGVLYRGVVQPVRRGCTWVVEQVDRLHETAEQVRDVVQFTAEFVVKTEQRLTRLETLARIGLVRHVPDD